MRWSCHIIMLTFTYWSGTKIRSQQRCLTNLLWRLWSLDMLRIAIPPTVCQVAPVIVEDQITAKYCIRRKESCEKKGMKFHLCYERKFHLLEKSWVKVVQAAAWGCVCYNIQNSKSLSSTHQLLHTASYVEVILLRRLGMVCPQLCYDCYHHFIKLTFISHRKERKCQYYSYNVYISHTNAINYSLFVYYYLFYCICFCSSCALKATPILLAKILTYL